MLSPDITTVRDLIDRMAEIKAESPFLFGPESDCEWTFAELRRQVRRIARKFASLGLAKGDKVSFLMDNGLFTSGLLLGAMYGGYVAVPVNVRAGRSQLAYTLDHCDTRVVFVSENYRSLVEEVRPDVSLDLQVIVADADMGPLAWKGVASLEGALPEVFPDDDALLMYTSGSTGQPKGAVHSHQKFLAAALNSVLAHDLTAQDCSLCVLPLYHINAINVTLVPTLITGGSVVMPRRFLVRSFWEWLTRHRCTWSALVPTIISQLVDWVDPRADGMAEALQKIRFLRSSSAPLAPSLHRAFEEKFHLPLIEAMGSTECGGNIFSNPPPPAKDKVGTPGLPYGFEARTVDPAGLDVPAGQPGEILLRGPGVMTGYYKNPEGTSAVLGRDGWLHTGDLAFKDEDGFFFIVGRAKELIIKGA
jgi:acyl-CoA synthetase (AMP-forming)/AMP-acid ligase II